MVYPTTGFHPSSSSASTSHGSLIFDHERQLPKPMCGTATLTKLGLLPSHTKRKQHRYLRDSTKQYQSIPIELTPINTLFVTEQEFLRGQHGTTSSETGSCDSAPLASPDSIEFSTVIPQFDVNKALVHQGLAEEPTSPERPRSVTPRSSNKKFDFSNPEFEAEEEAEEDDYMVFEDGPEEPPLSPHSPPQMHREDAPLYVSTEVDNEGNSGMMQTVSKDNSSISTKEDSCESSDQSSLCEDRGREVEEEKALIAMRDTILKQQENLQRLAIKNQLYRDRLAASHGRVQSLYKNHLGSIEAIVKLQFERESFEAEAVLLREELKKIRNELSMIHKDKDSNNLKDDRYINMQIAPSREATSEVRWTRAQGSILYHQPQAIDHDQQLVDEPLTPSSFSSPSHASSQILAPVSNTLEESEEPSHASRDVEGVLPSSWTETPPPLAHGRLSSLRSPKHSSSVASQGSTVDMTKDSEMSTPTHQRKTVRFHATNETYVEQIVDEQKTKLPSSPTTRWSQAKKPELPTSTSPISREDMSDERCEASQQPMKQNTIRHLLSPGIPVASPSSGVPDGTSSSQQQHEGVDPRRISDDNQTAEIAAFIGWASRHQISHKPSPQKPDSPLSEANRQLHPRGQHHFDSPLSQTRTQPSQHDSRQPAPTDQKPSPRRDFEEAERLNHRTATQAAIPSQSKTVPLRSPRSLQRTWEKPNSDEVDLQTLKDRIGSSHPSPSQSVKWDETQPLRDSLEEPLEEPESSEEKTVGDLSSGPSLPEASPRKPLSPSFTAHPSSPVRQRNDEKLESKSHIDSPQQPLSPRSRYLAAVTRPFPENSTIMLSKVRNDQGVSARTATVQPRQPDASNHQTYGKPKTAQSDFWENQLKMCTPEQADETSKPVPPERHRIQEHELPPTLSEAVTTKDPPSSSFSAIEGSKVTKMEPPSLLYNGMTKVTSTSSFVPEKRSARTLEDYRDLYRAQNQPRSDLAMMKSHPSPALGPATSPRATHHFPISPTSDSALQRKATERVRNREGKDGSSSNLKRQFNKVKRQATAPTMSYAEANAELRWVKSQQRILESMKVNVDAKGSRGNVPVQKGHDTEELVNPNNIEELNKRVNRVRMQLIKVTLEENEEREARDDMGNGRDDLDDLDVHYGREYGDVRERKHTTFRSTTSSRE